MKHIIRISLGVALIAFLGACSSLADEPLELSGKSSVTGSIELVSSESLRSTTPNYGSQVSFDTQVNGKMSRNSRLYVRLICRQGDNVVYQASANPDADFQLTDQPGQGLEWDGTSASCIAELIYKVDKGKGYDLNFLDNTLFEVISES